MKSKLKNIIFKISCFFILRLKSNPKLKSVLHPVLIQIPFFNKILFFLKTQISNSNNTIGPLCTSPKNFHDLTQSGQSYFNNIKNSLETLKHNANTD